MAGGICGGVFIRGNMVFFILFIYLFSYLFEFIYLFIYFLQGITPCQATLACAFIVLLYTSRAVYNIIAVTVHVCPSFGYGWILTDQVGVQNRVNVVVKATWSCV